MNKKHVVIGMIILIVFIITIIIAIILVNQNENTPQEYENSMMSGLEVMNSTKPVEEIERYDYNQYVTKVIGDQDIVNIYFNDYRYYAIYHPQEAYELLDKEYREKKFGNFETFQNYISQNMDKIFTSSIESFTVSNWNGGKQYIAIDKEGKYYIFQENVVMDYSVILDTYTIDLPEFLEQYNSSTEAEKVLLNIQKVFEAINQQDYVYVYEKLDETFKTNNFPTLQEFENYIKENFFVQNTATASNPESQGNIYMYEINISDATGENTNTITKTFVMQLQEGTDFVMSFSV